MGFGVNTDIGSRVQNSQAEVNVKRGIGKAREAVHNIKEPCVSSKVNSYIGKIEASKIRNYDPGKGQNVDREG